MPKKRVNINKALNLIAETISKCIKEYTALVIPQPGHFKPVNKLKKQGIKGVSAGLLK